MTNFKSRCEFLEFGLSKPPLNFIFPIIHFNFHSALLHIHSFISKMDELRDAFIQQLSIHQNEQRQGQNDGGISTAQPHRISAILLRHHLLPIWQKLWDFEPYCLPFRYPFDPVELGIPVCFRLKKSKYKFNIF